MVCQLTPFLVPSPRQPLSCLRNDPCQQLIPVSRTELSDVLSLHSSPVSPFLSLLMLFSRGWIRILLLLFSTAKQPCTLFLARTFCSHTLHKER